MEDEKSAEDTADSTILIERSTSSSFLISLKLRDIWVMIFLCLRKLMSNTISAVPVSNPVIVINLIAVIFGTNSQRYKALEPRKKRNL
jgi:hypothetical protein